MEKRLQKFISEAGVMSRRAAEEEIKKGRIKVNGVTAVLGQKIDDESDVVEYLGKRINGVRKKHVYIMLNKPVGFVTTMSDEQGRPCVAELVAESPSARIRWWRVSRGVLPMSRVALL
jgi:23S rRNA pseudouridine2605 synthase